MFNDIENEKKLTYSRRVLIVLHGAIGDVVRALPLAVRIKKAWTECQLDWAVETISEPLLTDHPFIDNVILFKRGGGLRAYADFIYRLRECEYDLVLDLQRHIKSGMTSFLTRHKRSIGFAYNNSREGNFLFHKEHINAQPHFSSKTLQYQKFGDYLNLPVTEPLDFGFVPVSATMEKISLLFSSQIQHYKIALPAKEKRVALILGSTWSSRFWIADSYVELIKYLWKSWGIVCVLVGGRYEVDFSKEILEKIEKVPIIDMVGRTSIRALVELFSSVYLAIGSDSGPMHIAAAVRLPVISLWGSTSSKRSAPYGNEKYVIQSNAVCSPCYKRDCPLEPRNLCMREIRHEKVLAYVKEIMSL